MAGLLVSLLVVATVVIVALGLLAALPLLLRSPPLLANIPFRATDALADDSEAPECDEFLASTPQAETQLLNPRPMVICVQTQQQERQDCRTYMLTAVVSWKRT